MKEKKTKKQLTNKQAKFVKEYVINDRGVKGSVVAAGYDVGNPNSAAIIGNRMLKSPKIQNEIKAELDKLYPDSRRTRFHVLHEILENPKQQPNARMKAIEIVNKMVGDAAPSRHERAEVKVTLPRLPGSKE